METNTIILILGIITFVLLNLCVMFKFKATNAELRIDALVWANQIKRTEIRELKEELDLLQEENHALVKNNICFITKRK